jgi:CheY-like chemotaxis protein
MSYPRKLHILIIEDELDPIETYREVLRAQNASFPSVEPVIAHSYDDARAHIEGSQPFHIVILDLNLPLATRQAPAEGVAPGQQLLELLAQRENYPVPVVLVASGRLQMTRLSQLQERLKTDFWYGEMVNKGPDVAAELCRASQKAHEYCDVGLHIADAPGQWFLPLSPREEDLLRRCVLSQTGCLGLDLAWWAAETGPSMSRRSSDSGPTKVLMGRFLLDNAMEASRPAFFKLEPVGNAPHVCRDAAILDQKLRHVKVKCSLGSRSRSLLVTQSVTNGVPVSLDKFLQGEPSAVQPVLPGLVDDIIGQLNELGKSTDHELPIRELLWQWHDRANITAGLKRFGGEAPIEHERGPLEIFDALSGSAHRTWIGKRSCTHGDLNVSNIAVDTTGPGSPRAYIFDAAGLHADVDMRDLAMLEVTTLLFNATEDDFDVVLDLVYGNDFTITSSPDHRECTAWRQNTLALIILLRERVQQAGKSTAYALMLVDVALMQFGGLTIQSSHNKIADPTKAHALAHYACRWMVDVAPDLSLEFKDSQTDSVKENTSPGN